MRYCAYFCEENVWHLSQEPALPPERRVVFISNGPRQVAMKHQKAGRGGVVFWDYHVVLTTPGMVWDLDTGLGLPVAKTRYLAESFPGLGTPPRFRVIDAAEFVRTFASDRSHMDGQQPPPPWAPIGTGMNLMRFVDMDDAFVGTVLDLDTFRRIS